MSVPAPTRFLADKSALSRSHLQPVAERLTPLFAAAQVVTCPIIDLELLYSTRSGADHAQLRGELRAMRSYDVDRQVTARAVEVQGLLVDVGRHRLPIVDLLIAAVAEINDLTVLHYDKDFDTIAAVTAQPAEWVAPRGAL